MIGSYSEKIASHVLRAVFLAGGLRPQFDAEAPPQLPPSPVARRRAEPRPAEDGVATGVQLKETSPALARFLDRSFHGGYSGYSTPKITENTKGLISIHPMTIAILGARHVQTNLQDVNKNYNNQEVSRRMR